MKTIKISLFLIIVIASCFCTAQKQNMDKVSNVTATPSQLAFDSIGATKQLSIKVLPSTALDKMFTCTSSNSEVATVNSSGVVTAVGNGEATISINTRCGGKKAEVTATVSAEEPVINVGVRVEDDFIVFEADATKSALGKNWALRTEASPSASTIGGALAPINGTYIEYLGSTTAGTGINGGVDVLQYRFTPKTSGVYRLTGRMAQLLKAYGAPWDQCNDIFIKMEGDFVSGSTDIDTSILKTWKKYFGRGKDTWGSFTRMDKGNHALFDVYYKLTAGEEYVFSISGRSKGVCIDYFLLTTCPVVANESVDLAVANDERLRPESK